MSNFIERINRLFNWKQYARGRIRRSSRRSSSISNQSSNDSANISTRNNLYYDLRTESGNNTEQEAIQSIENQSQEHESLLLLSNLNTMNQPQQAQQQQQQNVLNSNQSQSTNNYVLSFSNSGSSSRTRRNRSSNHRRSHYNHHLRSIFSNSSSGNGILSPSSSTSSAASSSVSANTPTSTSTNTTNIDLFSNLKRKERNLLSACCAVFSIAVLAVSLVETRWFYLNGGGCNVNYIGLAHFFAPGRLEYQLEMSKVVKNQIIVYNFILPNGLGLLEFLFNI